MVHADVDVSGSKKFVEPRAEDAEFLLVRGQMRLKRTLLLLQPGYVRIAEHGHSVRSEREHLVDRRLKTRGGLVRESVDQIDAEALKSQFARRKNQVARHFIRLHAVN